MTPISRPLKMSVKTSGKILDILRQDEHLTIPELARSIGVTERSIERNIRKLQDQWKYTRQIIIDKIDFDE